MINFKYKIQKTSIKFILLLVAFFVSVSTLGVLALSSAPSNHNLNYNVSAKNQNATISNKLILTSSQLKNCQVYQDLINQLINSINTRVQNEISLFSTTSLRLESFYNLKSKVISNYSQLITVISSSQAKVNGDFENLKSASNFSCKMNNPKLAINNFQNILKNQMEDLYNYRTNIDNFIIALESANNVMLPKNNK